MVHISVLKKEIIENLNIDPAGVYVDLTLGAGGHSKDILAKLKTGKLVAFDLDIDAIKNFSNWLSENNLAERAILVNKGFDKLTDALVKLKITQVDGIIADLGWSTDQLESIPGLSFKDLDAELDMRFDKESNVRAADILNFVNKQELAKILADNADFYGKKSRDLVEQILAARKIRPFKTVGDLIEVLNNVQGSALHRGLRHGGLGDLPARVFQALRIAVNQELSTLQSMLPQAWDALKVGGSLQIITFHSREEQVVLEMISKWSTELCADLMYKNKFIQPSVGELRENLAARSAKLWGLIKC